MTADETLSEIQRAFPRVETASIPVKDYPTLRLASPDDLIPLVTWLKNHGFDYLDMLTAVDYLGPVDAKGYVRAPNFNALRPEGEPLPAPQSPTAGYPYRPNMELVWSFVSREEQVRIFLKLEVSRDKPTAPSLTGLFKSADWQEREVFDLLGVRYEGHPNLTKILTPDFLQGHPLRKDYVHVKDRYDE